MHRYPSIYAPSGIIGEHISFRITGGCPICRDCEPVWNPRSFTSPDGGYVRKRIGWSSGTLRQDYLQLLYLYPVQKLPILLPVSEDGLASIMVDEVLLNRREDREWLKNLSTTLSCKVEAKAALVAKVGSLMGSGKLKELEADNRTLQGEVAARDESIELLQQQIERQREEHQWQLMELQAKYRRKMSYKEAEHQKEVSFLKSIIQRKPRNGFLCSKSWCTWRSSA